MDAQLLTNLAAGSREFFAHGLPSALWNIYLWTKEWQTLIAAVLVIFAARYFFHATLRASRIMAEAAIRSARIAASAAIRQEAEDFSPAFDDESAQATAARQEPAVPSGFLDAKTSGADAGMNTEPRRQQPKPSPERKLLMRLDILRSTVRSALAAIPTSGSAITDKGVEMYAKVTAVSFDDIEPSHVIGSAALSLFHELQTALDTLRLENTEPTDGKQVWDALVRVNTLARELRSSLTPAPSERLRGDPPAEKAMVDKIALDKIAVEKTGLENTVLKKTA